MRCEPSIAYPAMMENLGPDLGATWASGTLLSTVVTRGVARLPFD